ncbi:unnamed protein product, partial [Timema podura]|nr:unnamed protein product [Timema podura]
MLSNYYDGGDQGLLNQFFSDWASQDIGRHLPFIYNMCSSATYSYLPAYKQFGELVKIVHFIGPNKPWLLHFDTETRQVRPPPGVEHLHTLLQIWWDFFCDNVHPTLSPTMIATYRESNTEILLVKSLPDSRCYSPLPEDSVLIEHT